MLKAKITKGGNNSMAQQTAAVQRKRDVDMTQGSIFKLLLQFALPLMAGNLFQQFYNMVDTWVVGNYVSNEAYSAVGTMGPIINMLIGFFSGFASGTGVVISQYYGAKMPHQVRKAVHTALVMTVVMGVALTAIGLVMIPTALRMINMPSEAVRDAATYLRILFSGLIGLMIYNMGAGILRAVGDSRRPFYFLVVSALTNIALDLLFVIKFDMGVAGVAWATVIAQAISAVLILITLMCSESVVQVKLRWLSPDISILKKIVRLGFPAAIQMAITAFSNIFVQSYINHFGTDCMSGWTTYSKVDMLMFLPMQSLALAATTFVGQNLGKGNVERAKKGIHTALMMSLAVTAVILVPLLLFAPQLTAFFNNKAEVVQYGTMLLRLLSPFYLLCCLNQVYAAGLRGAGNSRAPMFMMLGSFVVFRQVYLFVMANFISNQIIPIAMSYPAGWLLCALTTTIYYHKTPLDRYKVVQLSPQKPE